MLIEMQETSGMTAVPNVFIDSYMGPANGEYVKVYLCLLRLAGKSGEDTSLCGIADRLELTEKDVLRALRYWEKRKLVVLEKEGSEVRSLRLVSLTAEDTRSGETAVPVEPEPRLSMDLGAKKEAAPEKTEEPFSMSEELLTRLNGDTEFRQLAFVAEKYLARTLTSSDTRLLAYLYERLGFSQDLIVYLLEYCVEGGHRSGRYIETVALNWHQEGISTVEQAKELHRDYSRENREVSKAFGLTGRILGAEERKAVERWRREYHLPLEVIVEGCNATLRAIQKPSFEYADRVLKAWSDAGVATAEDAMAIQKERKISRKKQNAGDSTAPARKRKTAANYDQREVDYDALLASGKWY